MRSLSVMIKPSSGNCNMHCNYCFYCDEMAKRENRLYGYMSPETLKNVIRKTMLQAGEQITYAFQGGEPTLRGLDFFRQVVALEKQYNIHGIRVDNALQTNGYGLDGQWCQFLKENKFLVGVSVDGNRQIHDENRHTAGTGDPTYDRICENIRLLDKYQVDYNILTVVTAQAAAHPREIYQSFREKGWHYQQYIECLDPLGEPDCSKPYSLSPLAYGKFLTELFQLWYRDLQKHRQPFIRRFQNYIAILAGYPVEACDQRGTCGIQIVVEADGSAYPCDFYMLDEYRLGNFNTDRLPAMDQRREEIGFIARSRKICSTCRACPYYPVCRAGCQRSRDYVPEEDAYISHFCQGYRYFFDRCLPRLQDIAANLSQYPGL